MKDSRRVTKRLWMEEKNEDIKRNASKWSERTARAASLGGKFRKKYQLSL